MTEKKLIAKKKEIENTKTQIAELKGEKKALLTQLKDVWGCNTLEEAKTKIKAFEKKTNKLSEDIELDTIKLEETYFNEED